MRRAEQFIIHWIFIKENLRTASKESIAIIKQKENERGNESFSSFHRKIHFANLSFRGKLGKIPTHKPAFSPHLSRMAATYTGLRPAIVLVVGGPEGVQ